MKSKNGPTETAQPTGPKHTKKPSTEEAAQGRNAKSPVAKEQIRRTYHDRELVIDVVGGQFVFEGETYPSLSALAKSIVGYGISGPNFFRMSMPKPGKLTEGK